MSTEVASRYTKPTTPRPSPLPSSGNLLRWALLFVLLGGLALSVPVSPANALSSDVTLIPVARDTFASKAAPSSNFGTARWLRLRNDPRATAYLGFDLLALKGQAVERVELQLQLRDEAGKGISVSRVGNAWTESRLTWRTRPAALSRVTTLASKAPAGVLRINVTAAFPSGVVTDRLLSFRLTTSSANGVDFSSREGTARPVLRVTRSTASPTTPSPSPSVSPTPSPSVSPSPSPSVSPSPSPSISPSPSATPTEQLWYFGGNGSDHGVGMSQYGARGRANAGQTYDQILAHYYTGTTLGMIDAAQVVRVQLASAYMPSADVPARVTARGGTWTSATFLSADGQPLLFPVDSYIDMVPGSSWTANVHDGSGALLASSQATEVVMEPTSSATNFEMKFRDSLRRYDLYRGGMRLIARSTGIQAINIVAMDDYLKGVVPAEIPPLWHIEAVKTQAVAARGYVYVRLRPDRAFDVRPDSSNQVYGGVRIEHSRSNLAIEATANTVVMYKGQPADTLFFTVAGGHTESNEYVWVSSTGAVIGSPVPYLRGVPDVDPSGLAYDRNAPGFAWSSDPFTLSQLEGILAADSRTNVGKLVDVSFERGVSGRIHRATIVGSARTVTVSGVIFRNVYNRHRLSGPELNSVLFYLEKAPAP